MNDPRTKLSNNVVVSNFSSPHPFHFEDGSILAACSPERVKLGQLEQKETSRSFPHLPQKIKAVKPSFRITGIIVTELQRLHNDKEVDIVIVPFPLMECLRHLNLFGDMYKCATIRIKDRQNKIAYIDRFCR